MILLLNKDKGDKHFKLLETFKDTKEVALKKRDDITARLIKENGYRYLFLNLISINHKGVIARRLQPQLENQNVTATDRHSTKQTCILANGSTARRGMKSGALILECLGLGNMPACIRS